MKKTSTTITLWVRLAIAMILLTGSVFFTTNIHAQTIALTSQEVLWIDANKCNAEGPRGAWLSFTITNNTANPLNNVFITFAGFTGTNASLFIAPSDPTRYFTTLAVGEVVPVYYYVDYSAVCNNDCPGGGVNYDCYSANYTLTVSSTGNPNVVRNGTVTTNELLTASAAGISQSSVLGPGYFVGQTFTQTVVYSFGNNEDLFFQPAGEAGFKDGCLRLIASKCTATSGGVTGILGVEDRLHFPAADVPGGGGTITIQYTWEVLCNNISQVANPWAAALSGSKYKYQGFGSSSTIPAANPAVSISKSVSPTFLATATSDGGFGAGIAQWTVTLTNSSSFPIVVNKVNDVIPSCMTISDASVASSQINELNTFIQPSIGSTGMVSWTGIRPGEPSTYEYRVPANGTLTLIYQTNVSGCASPAGYTNSATASIGTTTVGPATATLSIGQQQADLAITKTDGSTTYTPGVGVTYTVVASNPGPSNVVGATVTDNAPAGTTITSWSAVFAGGATGTANGTGNINETVSIPANGSITYTITVSVPSSLTGNLVNTATVSVPSGTTDPTPGNNTATDTDTPAPAADLAITKTDGSATYTPGVGVTYTVVASNPGPSNVVGATVTDNAPAGTTITSWTAVFAGGATGTANGTGNINETVNIPANGSITYTITVSVPSSLTGNLVNTATVSVPSGTTDPTPGNNTATDTDTPAPSADLAITKTDGSTTYTPGVGVTYTVVASNPGPSNVVGATVVDNAPAGTTITSWTAVFAGGATGTANGTGNINETVNIPANGSITYTITVSVPSSLTGNLVNTATVSVPSGTTDPTPGNNTATDTDTPAPVADLAITKTDGSATYTPGVGVTYTVVASNPGPSNVVGATVVDNAPAGTTITSWSAVFAGGATGTANGTGNINETVNIPANGSITYTITVSVPSSLTGNLVNTATVSVPSGTTDPTPGNNTATDTDIPAPVADLAITKTDGSATYTPGVGVTYTVVASNPGPSNVVGATVTDNAPAGTTITSWSAVFAGGATGAANGTGNINETVNIPANGSITYTITVSVPSSLTGNLVNTATVSVPSGTTDPTPGNNTATDTDTPAPAADLAITKTDGSTTYTPGVGVTYTVVASNPGPSNVVGATVVDNAPAGTTITSWSAVFAGGATGAANGTGNINETVNIPANGSITYTITVSVPSSLTGNLVNTATVSVPSGTTDPTPGNNTATDTDTPAPVADLAITKTDGSATYTPGVGVTYTVVASNPGPSNVVGATVVDNAPAGTTITSWSAVFAGGATGAANGTGNINETVNIPANGSITYTITVSVPSSLTGNLVNTATVSVPSGTTDPTPGNNTATDTDTPAPSADLAITKTDGSTTYTPGVGVTYTVVASNPGPSNVVGATVTDNAPAGTTITSWSAVFAGGATGAANGTGNINETVNIPANGSITYTITVSVPSSLTGNLVNTATVSVPSGTTDPTPGNNTATDTDTPAPAADLAITKTDGSATYTPGVGVTYTVVASNPGPSNVVGATVVDNAPAGTTITSWSAVFAGGATGTANGTGNINETVNIPANGSITYTITVSVPSSLTGNLVNTATVSVPSGTTDPTPGNNTATDTDIPAPSADLAITKTDGSATYTPGVGVTYTVVASNPGPSNVVGATVVDNAPAGTTITSWSAVFAGGATGAANGTGNINETVNIPANGSITYTITVSVPSSLTGNLVNTATVSVPSGTTDPTPGNNTATDTDTPAPVADLAITKTDGSATYTPGVGVTYTVVASNPGPSNVVGATVVDNAPAGTTITSWTAVFAGGATGTANGTGNINETVNIPASGSITYTITVSVPSSLTGNLVNTATVSVPNGTTDPTPGNNTATDTDTPAPAADLAITKTDGSTTYTPGVGVTYTVVASNAGPSNVVGATVVDNAPAGTTITSWSAVFAGGATGTANGTGNINETVNIPANGSITYTITVSVPSSLTGNLVNTATVSVPSGTTDPTPGNNTATDTDTPAPAADLAITKTDGSTTYTPGVGVTYTVVASNPGPSNVVGATVVDNAPAGTTITSWSAVFAGGATGTANGTGNINETVNIPANGSITYTINVSVPSSLTGNLVNTATVSVPSGTTDPTPGNNTATDTDIPAPVADLAITKTDGSTTYTPGVGVTYTVVASNPGPSNVVGATVVDNAPAGTTITSWSAVFAGGATGTANGTGNINETVNIPANGSITYTITVSVPSSLTGNLVNTATVSVPSGTTDPTPGNNTATDTDIPAPAADLAITKTDGSATYTPGVGVTYTVVASNAGPSNVVGATVVDNAPAGTTITSWSAVFAGGATGTANGTGNISQTVNIPANGSVTYTINVSIPANLKGDLVNTATVSIPSSTTDPIPGNNTAMDLDTLLPLSCACQDVTVSLDAACQFRLTTDLLSNGNCAGSTVRVMDNNPSNGNIIDCAGVWTYGLFDASGNIICWGKVTAEDKRAPELVCAPADVTLDCYDVNYVLNNHMTIGNYGALPSPRPAANDPAKRTIANAEGVAGTGDNCQLGLIPPVLVNDNIKNLGYAYFRDNCRDCGCRVNLKWSDRVVYYSCTDTAFVRSGYYAKIERQWVATDCNGMSSSFVQDIFFKRPAIDEFVFKNENPDGKYDHVVTYNACTPDKSLIKKEDVTPFDCSWFDSEVNPRCLYIDQVECNYSVTTKDTEFPICGGKGVKIDREMYIFDWCKGGIVDTLHILIKIGDFEAPKLEYAHHAPYDISTGPMDCTAAIPVTAAGIKAQFGVTIKDNCTLGNIGVSVKTKDRYVKGILVAENVWEKVDYAVMNGMMIGLPVGTHRLIIDASDACYNAKKDSFEFKVLDKIAPVMKCDDDLHVSLSNANGYTNGYAQVSAADIDEGSWDNCKMAWIAVRRNVPASCEASFVQKGYDSNGNGRLDAAPFDHPKDAPANFDWSTVDGVDLNGDGDIRDFGEFVATKGGKKMTPLLDFVEFFCCDLSERVTVELWGADTADDPKTLADETNYNYCWMDLLIEDKVAPTCVAPWNVTIDCDDKNIALIDDKVASSKLWGDVTITTGNDCAALDTVYSVEKSLKCGYGKIVRKWTLSKQTAKGPITITCSQTIWVRPIHQYNIRFPKDAITDCKTPSPDTVIVDELACDLLAVNVSDKRYDATGDECYKIFRTYTVINWCAYDDKCGDPMAEGNVFVVDRGLFQNNGAAPIYVLVRDDDRDLNEEFYLSTNLTANEPLASNGRSGDYHVFGDGDRNGGDSGTGYRSTDYATYAAGLPAERRQNTMPRCDAYDLSTDHFQDWEYYHSFMYTQIIKVYDDTRPVVTGVRDTFCTSPTACTANIVKVVNLKDNCSDKVTLENQYLMIAPFQTTDAGKMILYSAPRWSIRDLGNGNYEISVTNLPEGTHDLIVVGRDECGNLSVATRIPFVVKDCKAPAPICINGLSTELMPDGNNSGMMTVWASDFVASKIYDCNGQGPETKDGLKLVTKYSINRVGEAVAPNKTSLLLTCADVGKVILVELHAWDEAGNHDFCVTFIDVQDNRKVCPGVDPLAGEISGVIATDDLEPLNGASLDLSGAAQMNQATASNGAYAFNNLTRGGDYTVTAQLDKNHLNGVSTFDLVLIQKHILGIESITNPYRLIAGDVNNSKTISSLDIIQIRKLILGIDAKYAHVASWKFVDATYRFPDASNPWSAAFPEVVNVNDLEGKVKADFTAIKMGDVSGNASASGAVATEIRGSNDWLLNVDEQELQSGQTYEVAFRAKDLAQIQGFQFTLQVLNQVSIEGLDYGVMKAENFGVFTSEGLITTSFHSTSALASDAVLFTLKLKANANIKLSEVLKLNSRRTNIEAYTQHNEVMGIQLNFSRKVISDQAALYQNTPNPFADETSIGFYLPNATRATLTVRDVKGALIYKVEGNYAKGNNQVILKQEQLSASGVLYYTLETNDFTATQKMVLLNK